jgi:anti-sigma B factor antagonist
MSAQIRYREHRGVLILELIGALRASRVAQSLVPAAEQALKTSTVEGIVLNVSDLESLDSAGLAELVRLYTMAGSRKLPLAISGAKPRIVKVLEIARLEPFFPNYPDEEGAVDGVLSQKKR